MTLDSGAPTVSAKTLTCFHCASTPCSNPENRIRRQQRHSDFPILFSFQRDSCRRKQTRRRSRWVVGRDGTLGGSLSPIWKQHACDNEQSAIRKARPSGSSGGLYNEGIESGSRAARVMAEAIESVMERKILQVDAIVKCSVREYS